MLVGSDHFQELSSYNSFMGSSDIDQTPSLITSTYTELTPLQPMSPVKTDHDAACMVELNNLHFYENLEPLKPTAMLNDHGQLEPCMQPSSLSTCSHSYFLPPVDCLELSKTLWSENVDGRSTATTNGLTKIQKSIESGSDNVNSPATSSPSTPTRSVSVALCADTEEVDTVDVAERVSLELRRFNIPQALFAQTVLSRSQGTLSELLRNPKPWAKMKTGRETYIRMLQWLREPEAERLAVLRRAGYLLCTFASVHYFYPLILYLTKNEFHSYWAWPSIISCSMADLFFHPDAFSHSIMDFVMCAHQTQKYPSYYVANVTIKYIMHTSYSLTIILFI